MKYTFTFTEEEREIMLKGLGKYYLSLIKDIMNDKDGLGYISKEVDILEVVIKKIAGEKNGEENN